MADPAPPICTARHDPLTADERLVLAVVSMLALQWSFTEDRVARLALAKTHAIAMRKDADFDRLHAVVAQMSAADSVVEWNFALSAAQLALLPILRRDLLAALRDIPVGV